MICFRLYTVQNQAKVSYTVVYGVKFTYGKTIKKKERTVLQNSRIEVTEIWLGRGTQGASEGLMMILMST